MDAPMRNATTVMKSWETTQVLRALIAINKHTLLPILYLI
jgi:hypothetical protein